MITKITNKDGDDVVNTQLSTSEFITFIHQQPSDLSIDNNNGFYKCAIGLYVKSKLMVSDVIWDDDYKSDVYYYHEICAKFSRNLYQRLPRDFCDNIWQGMSNNPYKNFGDLQKALTSV